jgi:hypothetical protein
MELRHHPLLTHRGTRTWPPLWHQRTGGALKMLQGEIGVLRNIHYSRDAGTRLCYLVIEHESEFFIGTLQFDDAHTCNDICRVIHEQIGRSIREIGSLDIADTLSL